jgi:hypothetical protein
MISHSARQLLRSSHRAPSCNPIEAFAKTEAKKIQLELRHVGCRTKYASVDYFAAIRRAWGSNGSQVADR